MYRFYRFVTKIREYFVRKYYRRGVWEACTESMRVLRKNTSIFYVKRFNTRYTYYIRVRVGVSAAVLITHAHTTTPYYDVHCTWWYTEHWLRVYVRAAVKNDIIDESEASQQ